MTSLAELTFTKSNWRRTVMDPGAEHDGCSTKLVEGQRHISSYRSVSGGWAAAANLASITEGVAAKFPLSRQKRPITDRPDLSLRRSPATSAGKRVSTRRFQSAEYIGLLCIVGSLAGCASAPLVQGVGLSSYDAMTPSDGLITKSRIQVKKDQVLAAKTVKIVPTTFPAALAPNLTAQQRQLVANAADRAICVRLSDRFKLATADEPADLLVRATVTQATETNEIAAGVSVATSIGMNFVEVGVPIPTPRIPIGLGSLSMEAEAIDASGRQQAAMLWARGANALFSSPRVSKANDAYDLADTFGEDFASLLVKGDSPFGSRGIDLPSLQKIGSTMGLAPKYVACERFGRYPGIVGMVGDQIGLPPEWTDKGGQQASR